MAKIDKAISKAFNISARNTKSTRSTERLKVLHGHIANELAKQLPEYTIYSDCFEDEKQPNVISKEKGLEGNFTNKKTDIVVEKDGKPVAAIAVKMIFSNYSQNSINYLEQVMAEAINLLGRDVDFYSMTFLRSVMPYYDSKREQVKKIENLNICNLYKYKKQIEPIVKQDGCEEYIIMAKDVGLWFYETSMDEYIKRFVESGDDFKFQEENDFEAKVLSADKIDTIKFSSNKCPNHKDEALDFLKEMKNPDEFINQIVNDIVKDIKK